MAPQESFEAASFISGERPPHLLKMEGKKVCLKMLFRLFQVFLAYVFLSGKLADPDSLPSPLSGKFH